MNMIMIGIILVIGLIAISFASILIKLCAAPSLVIAVYRLTIAAIFYLIFSKIKIRRFFPTLASSQKKIAIISGSFLTLHFITWITSIKYTSVASSVLLVQSAPIFVAIGSAIFLREKPSLRVLIGILITFAGSVIISIHDFSFNEASILGNLLAVGGAIGGAGYMIAGRKLRLQVDTLSYVTAVYSIAAVFLIILGIGCQVKFVGYDLNVYLLLAAIAFFPQIIGHTVINWSLKFFSATTVSVIILAEPIGASILAMILLDEQLRLMQIMGGAIVITGVLIVLLAEANRKK